MRSRSGNDGIQTYPDMATCVDETGLTGYTYGVLPLRFGKVYAAEMSIAYAAAGAARAPCSNSASTNTTTVSVDVPGTCRS